MSSRIRWPNSPGEAIYALLVGGLVIGMLISLPLWLSGRDFPHLPAVRFLPPFPPPWDAIALGLTLALLLASVVLPERPAVAGFGIGACILLGLQDQSRWQPWVYQYLLMLAAATASGDRNRPALLTLYRFIIVCGYFWSGFHKLGAGFQNLMAHGIADYLVRAWPAWGLSLLRATSPFIPWLEMAVGVTLCCALARRIGVVLAVTTHLFILLVLGPLGKQANLVVWPWNGVMIALVVLLFWKTKISRWRTMLVPGFRAVAVACAILVAVLPALSLVEKWDRYFSFHLYSGTERRFLIIVDQAAARVLPAAFQRRLSPSTASPDLQELRFFEWSLEELEAPFPAEKRTILTMGKKFAAMDFVRAGEVLFYTDYRFLLEERGWDIYTPEEMRSMNDLPPLRRKFEPPPK